MSSLVEDYISYIETKDDDVVLNEVVVLGVVVAYKLYKYMTDQCRKSCKMKGYKKNALSLCKSKCYINSSEKAIKHLEQKKKEMIRKAQDEKIKAKINKKFDKKVKFFKNKIEVQYRQLKTFEEKNKK